MSIAHVEDSAEPPLRVVIVDDEPLARRAVRRLLAEWGAVEIAAECEDGKGAVAAIAELEPDVVILDICMPELDGFEVLERAARRRPAIIFVSAFSEHAVRAFSVRAVDYLLKPLDENRFFEAMDRARESCRTRLVPAPPAAFLTHLRSRQGAGIRIIPCADLEWIEAADYYARVHTNCGRKFLVRDTLNYLSTHLHPQQFVRVHRSAIVNVDAVCELFPSMSEITLRSGAHVVLSRTGRNRLVQALHARRALAGR